MIADHGVTEIARRLELDPASVRLWRRGHKPYPQNIRALCKAFGVDREWLETGTERTPTENHERLPQTTVREDPHSAGLAEMSDDEIGTRLAGMIKNFAKMVPDPDFLIASIGVLRSYSAEFFARAERRAHGGAAKYPKPKNGKKP